jgi:hypothetical protein
MPVEDEMGIYREEALLMLTTLADIRASVERILAYIEGDDHEETEEDPTPDA